MLQLTKRTEYALIALTLLGERAGEVLSVREICERFPIPKRLLAEVLKDLSRSGMLESQRGANGGYVLARSPKSVTVGEVVGTLEGRPGLTSCESTGLHAGSPCDIEHVCPIRSPIDRLRGDLWSLLERTTLHDLIHPAPLSTESAISRAR